MPGRAARQHRNGQIRGRAPEIIRPEARVPSRFRRTRRHEPRRIAAPLRRYFPDVVAAVGKLKSKQFVIDGELAIPVNGALSFDELQLRLHPAASRVKKLAAAHPALFIAFDLLAEGRESSLKTPLRERR